MLVNIFTQFSGAVREEISQKKTSLTIIYSCTHKTQTKPERFLSDDILKHYKMNVYTLDSHLCPDQIPPLPKIISDSSP